MEASAKADLDTVLSLMDEDVVFLVAGQPPMRREEFASSFRTMNSQKLNIEAKPSFRKFK
jgi:ketosteroid isomerase-like protein